MQLSFTAQESKIFKFYIPPNTAADEFNKVKSVSIMAAPFLPGTQELLLTATAKRKSLASSGSKRGVSAWTKGQALRLSEERPDEWCYDCNVTILVDVVDAGRY